MPCHACFMPSLFHVKPVQVKSSQVCLCLDYVWMLDHFVNKLHLGSHYARLQWTHYRIHDQQNESSSFTSPLPASGRPAIEEYVADFCEVCHLVDFNDVTVKDIFRFGVDDPLVQVCQGELFVGHWNNILTLFCCWLGHLLLWELRMRSPATVLYPLLPSSLTSCLPSQSLLTSCLPSQSLLTSRLSPRPRWLPRQSLVTSQLSPRFPQRIFLGGGAIVPKLLQMRSLG